MQGHTNTEGMHRPDVLKLQPQKPAQWCVLSSVLQIPWIILISSETRECTEVVHTLGKLQKKKKDVERIWH